MNWNTVLGVFSTIAFLLPAAIIIHKKLFKCTSLMVLMVYYLLQFSYNLMTQGLVPSSGAMQKIIGIIFNYLDAPLMLVTLFFFCHTPAAKKAVRFSLIAVLLYEVITILIEGFTVRSVVFILAVDIFVVLAYSINFFMTELKMAFRNSRKIGRALMSVAILFSYGSYGFIWFVYYVQNTSAVSDVFLLFFMSSIVSSITMSIGLVFVSRRLKDLEDVKLTRKELKMFFNS